MCRIKKLEIIYLSSHNSLSLSDQIAFCTGAISPLAMSFMAFEPGNHAMVSTSCAFRSTSWCWIFVIEVYIDVGVGGSRCCSSDGVHSSVVRHKVATFESVAVAILRKLAIVKANAIANQMKALGGVTRIVSFSPSLNASEASYIYAYYISFTIFPKMFRCILVNVM